MIPLPEGPVPATADAVIVGGGINGLAIAYELARRGMKRLVVLERDYLGSGSTGRCGGGIRQQWTTAENIRLAQESVAAYEHLAGELGLQTFFRQGGYLMVTEDESHLDSLRKAVALQNSCQVPSRFLEPRECLDIVPQLDVGRPNCAPICHKDRNPDPGSGGGGDAEAPPPRGEDIELDIVYARARPSARRTAPPTRSAWCGATRRPRRGAACGSSSARACSRCGTTAAASPAWSPTAARSRRRC